MGIRDAEYQRRWWSSMTKIYSVIVGTEELTQEIIVIGEGVE